MTKCNFNEHIDFYEVNKLNYDFSLYNLQKDIFKITKSFFENLMTPELLKKIYLYTLLHGRTIDVNDDNLNKAINQFKKNYDSIVPDSKNINKLKLQCDQSNIIDEIIDTIRGKLSQIKNNYQLQGYIKLILDNEFFKKIKEIVKIGDDNNILVIIVIIKEVLLKIENKK